MIDIDTRGALEKRKNSEEKALIAGDSGLSLQLEKLQCKLREQIDRRNSLEEYSIDIQNIISTRYFSRELILALKLFKHSKI